MVSLVNFCVYTIKFVELVTSNVSVDICLCSFVMILIVMLQLESKNNFAKWSKYQQHINACLGDAIV